MEADVDPRERDLERLYREEAPRMWRAALGYCGDRHVAEEAVAEAFAQALRGGDRIRDPKAWLWRATFRLAAAELKRQRKTRVISSEQARTYELPLVPADLEAALRRIAPRQRAAVILHHYSGHPIRDVAKMLDSTTPAVKLLLHRGRARLRQLLEIDHA